MRKPLAALAITLATMGGLAWPGTSQASGNPEPWQPWEQEEWSVEPGVFCDFGFELDVIEQDIQRRVLERHDDGTVELEEYRGPLVSDFVRTDTGDKVRVDSGGRAFMSYHPDGSLESVTAIGPVGFGFRETDAYPRGYYNVDGYHVMSVSTDGTRSMAADAGPETDVCAQLS